MILSCQNIEKAFLEKQVLKNCSFHIEDYEKAAIVGLNGAGKTTLLRIIVGQLEPDGGVVAFAKDKTFGYLAQDSAVNHAAERRQRAVDFDSVRENDNAA